MKKFVLAGVCALAVLFGAGKAQACNPLIVSNFTPAVAVGTNGVVVNPFFTPTVVNVGNPLFFTGFRTNVIVTGRRNVVVRVRR